MRSHLSPNGQVAIFRDVSLAAADDLVGDLDYEGGDPLGAVVEGGHVEDHLHRVEQPEQRLLHLSRILSYYIN